jgi:hypothetical protein
VFVHVDPTLFERRPFLAVILGIALLALLVCALTVVYSEYRAFGKTPEIVDLRTIDAPPQDHGKWVRVTQPVTIDCNNGAQEQREYPERWLFGKVEDTLFAASIPGSDRTLLLEYDGDIRCDALAQMEKIGVLEELSPRRRWFLGGGALVLPRNGVVLKLCLSCGPAQSRQILIWGSALLILPLFVIQRYWTKYRRKLELEAAKTVGAIPSGYAPSIESPKHFLRNSR